MKNVKLSPLKKKGRKKKERKKDRKPYETVVTLRVAKAGSKNKHRGRF